MPTSSATRLASAKRPGVSRLQETVTSLTQSDSALGADHRLLFPSSMSAVARDSLEFPLKKPPTKARSQPSDGQPGRTVPRKLTALQRASPPFESKMLTLGLCGRVELCFTDGILTRSHYFYVRRTSEPK